MATNSFESGATPSGDPLLIFGETLGYDQVRSAWEEIVHFLDERRPLKLSLDFSRVTLADSAGIAFLRTLDHYCRRRGIEIDYAPLPPSIEQFLQYTRPEEGQFKPAAKRPWRDWVHRMGEQARETLWGAHALIRFGGAFFSVSLKSFTKLGRYRWRETLYYLQLSGADAVPILGLLSFLLGLVIAFEAAVQLRQFGANIFVADLVSLSITRELGPLLTAIILTGRSGSAFAAEIGTMKVNEEVDALAVMGFDIMDFLVLPKIHALIVAGPLLTLFADATGIAGGLVVGITGLDLTASSFFQEAMSNITVNDVFSGLIKSVVFAVLIALIGCFRGLRTEKGADSVGRQTTSAVVSGIFLIIVADSIFTVLFHIIDF